MSKKYKNGLVLGKFYPFHLGHKHLIDTSIENCDVVYVMVCSLKSELIRGIDRFLMVKNTYINDDNVIVINCVDENPQHPNESKSLDEFYNDYWVPSVRKHVKNLDVVFTSEDYGDEFASYLGCEHVLVDIERSKYHTSGTSVRNNILENWNLLPKQTQKFFKRKICIVGSESTGKSTMVKNLSEYYKTTYVEEYGRKYVESIPTDVLIDWDFLVIARNHARLVEKASDENENMFLFVDTDAIITKTFAKMYLDKDIREIDDYIYRQKFDLYLLLTPDVEWVDDGTRDFSDNNDRWNHIKLIKAELDKNNFNYKIISGSDYNKRLNEAVSYINEFTTINGNECVNKTM